MCRLHPILVVVTTRLFHAARKLPRTRGITMSLCTGPQSAPQTYAKVPPMLVKHFRRRIVKLAKRISEESRRVTATRLLEIGHEIDPCPHGASPPTPFLLSVSSCFWEQMVRINIAGPPLVAFDIHVLSHTHNLDIPTGHVGKVRFVSSIVGVGDFGCSTHLL